MSSSLVNLDLFRASATSLFPREECPICLVLLPHCSTNAIHPYTHQVCCGKLLCFACYFEYNVTNNNACALCRVPTPTSRQEIIQRGNARIILGDTEAMLVRGIELQRGLNGMDVDLTQAFELFVKGANAGNVECLHEVALALLQDNLGVNPDYQLGLEYLSLIAEEYKHPSANLTLGTMSETTARNNNCNDHYQMAINYYINAAEYGMELACTKLRGLYRDGFATKEEFMSSLRKYQSYVATVKTDKRDEVAKATNQGKYY